MPRLGLHGLTYYADPKDGEKWGVFGDLHIGIEDKPAANLMIECFEREGIDLTCANGDIVNCATVAPHEGSQREAAIEHGFLMDEADSGREYLDWLATRPCLYGEGNHEDWINDVAKRTGTVGSLTVKSALGLHPSIQVLPQAYQIRAGSLVIEHGDVTLGRGSGGVNLARTILTRYPDQTTVVNHFHRMDMAIRTAPDQRDVFRSRAAFSLGHMSQVRRHTEYASRAPNWQTGFAIIEFWRVDGQIRYNVNPIEIHRDRRGRPVFSYRGHTYR